MLYFSNNAIFWFIILSLLLLNSSICICEMSFILVLDMIPVCKYISFFSSMFNSIGSSPISPSSAGFGVETGRFNIVLIMVNYMSVSSLISYWRTKFHIHIKALVIMLFWYSFINVLEFICESISFLVVLIQTWKIDWMFVFFSFKCWVIFGSFVKVSPRYFIFFLTVYALLPTIIFELPVLLFLLLNICTPFFIIYFQIQFVTYIFQYCQHIFQLVYIWTCHGYVIHK